MAGDKNISILHLPCRTSYLKFSLVLQTHALVLKNCMQKENGGRGGGVGNLMFLEFLISLLKWYLPTAVSFITASHTLTKRVLHSILMLRLSFLKIAFSFHFSCRNFRMSDILAEPLLDWFINLLRLSTFSYKEEKSIITAIQSVTIQTYFIDENALRKKSIFTLIQSTTLPRIILCSCHSPFAITTSGFYFQNWKGIWLDGNASCHSENASFTRRI